jgi:hypothetical protein
MKGIIMKLEFIGAGNVTRTFGRHLITAGHTIVVSNSRGPETLANFVADLGPAAIAGTKEQAAECDVVILATHWMNVPEALKGIDWHGRIVIDATNALTNHDYDYRKEWIRERLKLLASVFAIDICAADPARQVSVTSRLDRSTASGGQSRGNPNSARANSGATGNRRRRLDRDSAAIRSPV